MSNAKPKPAKEQNKPAPAQPAAPVPLNSVTPPLFRKIDWLTFAVTALLVFVGYYLTLAPDLTLEDSGELATGSFYAGVPHPPGYPVWTIFTWLFTVLVPVSNIAWRVALASAVSGALACGLIALIVSRGGSMILEGIEEFKNIDRRLENALCVLSGYVAGMLIGFNGFMWSQAVIVEVYPFSLLSFVGVLGCLLRWVYAPHQRRYLYGALFLFGVCFTNHMTLIVAAMGIEAAIAATHPRLGRDLFLGNSVIFLAGLVARGNGMLPAFDNNGPLFAIYVVIGLGSIAAWLFLASMTMKKLENWMALLRDVLMFLSAAYILFLILIAAKVFPANDPRSSPAALHVFGLGALLAFVLPPLISKKDKSAALPPWGIVVLGLTGLYLVTLLATATGKVSLFNKTPGMFLVHTLIGLVLVALSGRMLMRVQKIGTVVFPVAALAGLWLLGAAFYLYMPLASMTNPPMNWGYPRTWDGFLHVLTRGQYERTNPTNNIGRFVEQMSMLFSGAVDEFNLGYLALGLIPFFFFARMQKRERAWLTGVVAIYLCLGVLLMMLLNPSPDRQSRELNRVFFTASHVMISLCIGYGMTLLGAMMTTQYARFRVFGWAGGAVAMAISLFVALIVFQRDGESAISTTASFFGLEPSHYWIDRVVAMSSVVMAALITGAFLLKRQRAPISVLLLAYSLMPLKSILSHWSDNEEHGHLFGYWFGHDMFTPPFTAPDGKLSYDAKLREQAMKGPNAGLVYPEMARDAVLFGGTDPGRFCPTYMIFCESFIPARCKPRDPVFDRRDVYIITQNALADGTYLEYIRAQYNRSTQNDTPFFQDMLRTQTDVQRKTTNYLAQLAAPLDHYFTHLGAGIEKRRRDEHVYPPNEIKTPSPEDSQKAFNDYMYDAERRQRLNQLKPGEDVRVDKESGRLTVQGQVAVMSINGLLTKDIFDANPTNEFYVEESFPLDWMYPYLEPFGIIMKIDRKPLPEITDDIIKRDHEFWSRYSDRLIGNWITYDTPVKDICDFALRVYDRRDYRGFSGDRKFIRDDQAQKSFSKLRSSIGGIYSWRYSTAKTPAERERMFKEADFAFRQSFAFCPFSPEAVFRYTQMLAQVGRLDDAERIIETSLQFDRSNVQMQAWAGQIKAVRQSPGAMQNQFTQARQKLAQLEQEFQTNPANGKLAFELASLYLQMQRTNDAFRILDRLINGPQTDASVLLSVASAYAQLQDGGRLETVLEKLVKVNPDNPEAWFDLASTQATIRKNSNAVQSLGRALELSDQRLRQQPGSQNLRANVTTNHSFDALRSLPEFRKLLTSK